MKNTILKTKGGASVALMGLALTACGSQSASAAGNPAPKQVAAAGTSATSANRPAPPSYHVVATWPAGSTPHFPGVDPQLHKLFVSNLAAGTLTVIDTRTGKISGTIKLGGTVHTVVVDAKTQRVYVTDIARGYLDVINARTDAVIKELPVGAHLHGLAVSNRLHEAFVTDVAQSRLYVVNTLTNKVVNPAGLAVGANPWGVAVDAGTHTAYVANTGVTLTGTVDPAGDSVSVVNLSTMTVTKTITVGPHPWNVATDPRTNTIYVGVAGSGQVAVIRNGAVVTDIAVGKSPHGVALDRKLGVLFVNNSLSNTVSIINVAADTVSATVKVGSQPQGVAVGPKGTAYVVNQKSGTVSVLRRTTG